MRNLFSILVLANLLFLGWRLWVSPPDVVATELAFAGQEPLITVLRPEAASPGSADIRETGIRLPVSTSPGSQCLRIGPIADGPVADALRARLAADGFDVATTVEEGQIWVGHWVQLDGITSREEADRIVARLTAGGLPDAYVLQNTAPFTISLGVFRDRERADSVASAAGRLGVRARTTDRYRPGTQFWLAVVIPPGIDLSLDSLGRESGRILRAEQIDCPAR